MNPVQKSAQTLQVQLHLSQIRFGLHCPIWLIKWVESNFRVTSRAVNLFGLSWALLFCLSVKLFLLVLLFCLSLVSCSFYCARSPLTAWQKCEHTLSVHCSGDRQTTRKMRLQLTQQQSPQNLLLTHMPRFPRLKTLSASGDRPQCCVIMMPLPGWPNWASSASSSSSSLGKAARSSSSLSAS